MEEEKQALIDHPGHFRMEAAPFVNSVGRFWDILNTRDYMRARLVLANKMEMIHTVESAEGQLEHYMDMLRLSRGDNMGIRNVVPGLMLRLDKDQECYDFIKWWSLVHKTPRDDWGVTDMPYLDIKNADVFEPVDYSNQRFYDLCHSTCLIILKIKLLLDLEKLQQSTSYLGTKVPREILDLIQTYILQSPILRENPQLTSEDGEKLAARVDDLKAQIDGLFDMIHIENKHFWPALADPDLHLQARPKEYIPGSLSEVDFCLQYTYSAMTETPGALDFIKDKFQSVYID